MDTPRWTCWEVFTEADGTAGASNKGNENLREPRAPRCSSASPGLPLVAIWDGSLSRDTQVWPALRRGRPRPAPQQAEQRTLGPPSEQELLQQPCAVVHTQPHCGSFSLPQQAAPNLCSLRVLTSSVPVVTCGNTSREARISLTQAAAGRRLRTDWLPRAAQSFLRILGGCLPLAGFHQATLKKETQNECFGLSCADDCSFESPFLLWILLSRVKQGSTGWCGFGFVGCGNHFSSAEFSPGPREGRLSGNTVLPRPRLPFLPPA